MGGVFGRSHGIHVVDLQHDDRLKKVSVRDLYKKYQSHEWYVWGLWVLVMILLIEEMRRSPPAMYKTPHKVGMINY